MRFSFTIIGGGLTATAMLKHFVDQVGQAAEQALLDPAHIEIQVFEKQETFGPGFPHCQKYLMPFHVTNMCAMDMGIVSGRPGDFQKWVDQNLRALQDRLPEFSTFFSSPDIIDRPCNHYPRAIMGEYLKTRFQDAVRDARELGMHVGLYVRCEVTNLDEKEDCVSLTIRNLESGKFFFKKSDRVLLATGHWFNENEDGGYFPSPWPAQNLMDKIPCGEKVAVIGTSLSAIETVLTLTSDGKFIRDHLSELFYLPPAHPRKIVLYSRKGLLPKVRGRIGRHKNRILTRNSVDRLLSEHRGQLTLDHLFEVVNEELEAAYGRPIDWDNVLNPTGSAADLLAQHIDDALSGDSPSGVLIWQSVLQQLLPMARKLYNNLSMSERERFEKDYATLFFTYAATQPTINAEKLLALLKSGHVEVHSLGKAYRLQKNEETGLYDFIFINRLGNMTTDSYRYVVNARGQEKSIVSNPSKLAKNSVASGVVQIAEIPQRDYPEILDEKVPREPYRRVRPYKTGSIWIDTETHGIMKLMPDGTAIPSKTIYAVGAMTRGQIIDASMANGSVRSTATIAKNLIAHLKKVAKGS